MHVSSICVYQRGKKKNDSSVVTTISRSHTEAYQCHFPQKETLGSLEKWLNVDLRQEIHEVSQRHLARAESKEGIKDRVVTKKPSGANLKKLHLAKDETEYQ